MSDREIDTLLKIFDHTGNWKDAALDAFSDVKDKASDYKGNVVDTVEDIFNK